MGSIKCDFGLFEILLNIKFMYIFKEIDDSLKTNIPIFHYSIIPEREKIQP